MKQNEKYLLNWSFTGRVLPIAICICVVLPPIAVELCITIESAIYLQHTYHYAALKGSQFCLDNFIQKRCFRTAISCYSNYESDIKNDWKMGKGRGENFHKIHAKSFQRVSSIKVFIFVCGQLFWLLLLISHVAEEGVCDQCRNGAFNYRDWIEINTLK